MEDRERADADRYVLDDEHQDGHAVEPEDGRLRRRQVPDVGARGCCQELGPGRGRERLTRARGLGRRLGQDRLDQSSVGGRGDLIGCRMRDRRPERADAVVLDGQDGLLAALELGSAVGWGDDDEVERTGAQFRTRRGRIVDDADDDDLRSCVGRVARDVGRQPRAFRDDECCAKGRGPDETEAEERQHQEWPEYDAEHGHRAADHVDELLARHSQHAEDRLEEGHHAASRPGACSPGSSRFGRRPCLPGSTDQLGEDVVERGAVLADGGDRPAGPLDGLDDARRAGCRIGGRQVHGARSHLIDVVDLVVMRQSAGVDHAIGLDLDDLATECLSSQVLGRRVRQEAAFCDERDVVALLGLSDILGRDHDRAMGVPKALELRPDGLAQERIDARRRLVEEEQVRFMDQRGCQLQPALHAARQVAGASVPRIPEGEAR